MWKCAVMWKILDRGPFARSRLERAWPNRQNEQCPAAFPRHARATRADADIANVLTLDEARRIASNIAKLPGLLKAKG